MTEHELSQDAPSGRLAGRRAIVTGGASGIGAATVRRLLEDGASVVALDARPGAAAELAAALAAEGWASRVHGLDADVSDQESTASAVATAAELLGGLDSVVAAAGIARPGTTLELTLEEWNRNLAVNLTGVFLTVQTALPHLLQNGGGAIVTVGSVASVVAAGQSSVYDASKGGVLLFTKAIAAEFADRNIRANCLLPGLVRTGLAANTTALHGKATGTPISPATKMPVPISRFADPREMTGAVAFLLSDDASFVTGASLAADGGYTAI